MMATAPARMPLTLVRMPGTQGPMVRCSGDLTIRTAEALRRDLGILISPGCGQLSVDLSGIRQIDAEGALALLELGLRLEGAGGQMLLLAETDPVRTYLHLTGVDRVMEVRTASRTGDAPGPEAPATTL